MRCRHANLRLSGSERLLRFCCCFWVFVIPVLATCWPSAPCLTACPVQQTLEAVSTKSPIAEQSAAEQSAAEQSATELSAGEVSTADLEFFESKIRPLLVEHCYACHSGDERSGGLSVESREMLLAGGDSGPAVNLAESVVENLPDRRSTSLLLRAIEYQDEAIKMPPDGRLSEQQIEWVRQWINRGLPDPRVTPMSEGGSHAAVVGMSLEEGKQFWSFKPVDSYAPPEVQDTTWVQNPIDQFVLHQLERQGLTPAPRADKRTLIRRLSLNLTGLPPSHEEVERFVADDSPDAYRRLLESLLASPQYGVRWGRHWLDVARYADSNGLDENIAYGTAWRYRDYVIQAFNDDKPYDQFLIEQIAGDLLPHANDHTRTATGFMALGAKVLAEPDVEKLMMDTIDEQLDTVGKAFLGLSLGCARCHDHKFDPITQQDYYALAAILKGTRTFADERFGAIKYWYEHSLDTDQSDQELKNAEATIAATKQAASKFKAQAYEKIRQTARSQAVDYLVAASELHQGATLVQVQQVAEPLGLHPRILHYARTHIENQRESNFFKVWHEQKSNGQAIRDYYSVLFQRVDAAWEKAQHDTSSASTLSDPELEEARLARLDPAGFLAIPPQPEYALDQVDLKEYYRLMEESRVVESNAPDRNTAMGVSEALTVHALPIHIRGSHLNLGELVERGFPKVMQWSQVPPIFTDHQSGRLELAQWLASTANPLTARVMVNRLWGWHFGQALVPSTENFGAQGDRPSHPQLLDWLARRFMQSGWSMKELHRLILLSSTYQMSSEHPHPENAENIDAENHWHWKFPLRRLDAEQLRDSILACSGRLQLQLDGKSVPLRNRQFVFDHTSIDHTRYDSLRRAVYLPIIRNNLYTLFQQFDYPDPTMPTGLRTQTTVAPQSLLMMNNPLVIESSQELARTIVQQFSEDRSRLDFVFRLILCREPQATELAGCLDYLADFSANGRLDAVHIAAENQIQAWAGLIQALWATNDFMYVR